MTCCSVKIKQKLCVMSEEAINWKEISISLGWWKHWGEHYLLRYVYIEI